jgi:hypothetical protein
MRTIRPWLTGFPYRDLMIGAAAALAALLAGCDNDFTRAVHQKCASAPDVQACEQAEYDRLYAEERYRNRRIAYP